METRKSLGKSQMSNFSASISTHNYLIPFFGWLSVKREKVSQALKIERASSVKKVAVIEAT